MCNFAHRFGSHDFLTQGQLSLFGVKISYLGFNDEHLVVQ